MDERSRPPVSPPADRNIRVIAALERKALHDRAFGDRLSDAITRGTGSAPFVAANLAIFAAWIALNTWGVGTLQPFDPFPFSLLTLVVSLEAIFLAIFVLMSQNRMARAADKRAHLDLQVDLLAEQELTTMLRMLQALCAKLKVDVDVGDEQMQDLLRETDVDKLAKALDRGLPAS